MLKINMYSQMIAATIATSLLIGCGSGSGSDSENQHHKPITDSTTDITGSVFTPYVAGAQVEVTDIKGNAIAEPVKTDSNGQFTIAIPDANLNDDLLFTATGGNYTNAITGKDNVESKRLATFAAANSLTETPVINLTAASTIIADITDSIDDNATAKTYFETAFGYLPNISVLPIAANQENKIASAEAKLAGVRAAVFSQLLTDFELAEDEQTNLLTAIAKDLSDGTADGFSNTAPVQIINGTNLSTDIANRFSMALIDFAKDTDLNKSGISPGQVGVLAFNKKAVSKNYQFELTPQSKPMKGKSVFDLKITDHSNAAVVGVTPTMQLWMYMSNHGHSNPHAGCTKTDAEGTSQCTAYFTMASGKGMGNWELTFSVGTGDNQEKARFFPSVGMPMGEDTAWLPLYGTDSLYLVYKNDVVKTDSGHTVKFFVATRKSMAEWPHLPAELVTLQAGTEESDLSDATSEGNGVWSINLEGLTAGKSNTVYIKLSRNGETKVFYNWAKDENGEWIPTPSDDEFTAFNLTPAE